MKLSTLYITSLAFIPSLISAAVVPEAAHEDAALRKRGPEVNYICDCARYDSDQANDYDASYMAWYLNQDNSQNGEQPGSLSSEYRKWTNGWGTYLDWEGNQQNIYFPDSGVTVSTYINAGANNLNTGDRAGSARRSSDGKWFNCYKDNGRTLFTKNPPVPDGTDLSIRCYARYFCN